jgi:hypothetical protein
VRCDLTARRRVSLVLTVASDTVGHARSAPQKKGAWHDGQFGDFGVNESPHLRDDIAVKFILNATDASHWLKGIIRTGLERDPVDVIKDLRAALMVYEEAIARCNAERDDL